MNSKAANEDMFQQSIVLEHFMVYSFSLEHLVLLAKIIRTSLASYYQPAGTKCILHTAYYILHTVI